MRCSHYKLYYYTDISSLFILRFNLDMNRTGYFEARYRSSTFFLAQGVFRRNLRLDFTEGLLLKHRILMSIPNSSQPYSSTRLFTICSRVTPCRGLLGCSSVISRDYSFHLNILTLRCIYKVYHFHMIYYSRSYSDIT